MEKVFETQESQSFRGYPGPDGMPRDDRNRIWRPVRETA
jgi:hypothetical protein